MHQPHNLEGERRDGGVSRADQVACFDTAFHRAHPFVADTFALPRELYDQGVRRYGFHGLSCEYVLRRLRVVAPTVANGRVVIAHLGNGASACGVRCGQFVSSTMSFTALDGLPMGTLRPTRLRRRALSDLREGHERGRDLDLLYKRSGLLGLSGVSNDMRAFEASNEPAARQAIDYFVERV